MCIEVARPWLFGMILGGEAGVEQVIRHTLADLDITMANAGYPRISDFQGKGEEVLMNLDF
jgi:lactate 2-monooxygenase